MNGFLVSAGVYPSEQAAHPAPRRRQGRVLASQPLAPVPVDGALPVVQPRDTTLAAPVRRPGRTLSRVSFSLRAYPQSEDVAVMLAWLNRAVAGRSESFRPVRQGDSSAELPPTWLSPLPLPDAPASGRPHHRPAAGRGQGGESSAFYVSAVWPGAGSLAFSADAFVGPANRASRGASFFSPSQNWPVGRDFLVGVFWPDAQTARPVYSAGHGRSVFTISQRWPIGGDFVSELTCQGQSVRPPREEARPAGASAAALVRPREGETLDWTASLVVGPRHARPARRPAGSPSFDSMTTTELPRFVATIAGQVVRVVHAGHSGRASADALSVRDPVEQTFVAGATVAAALRHSRSGRCVIDTAAEVHASYRDTYIGPADRGWLFGGATAYPRGTHGGRTSGELTLSVELAAPPLVPSQILASAPVRHPGRAPHVEYSAPDWHGAGLIVYAGVVVPDEE